MAIEYVLKDDDDGAIIGGASTSKIAFFGATTPVVRQTLTNSTVTVSLSSSSGAWGCSTSSQMSSLVGIVNELGAAMYTYGLMG